AEAAAVQSRLELIDAPGRPRKIMRSEIVGVHGQIGLDALEARDHAGKGTHVFAEPGDRGPRRNGPVPSARHDQLAAGARYDRHRCAAGVAQLLAAAGPAWRRGRDVMFDDSRAQQVEADDVIAQVGTEVGGNRFCDLDSRSWMPLWPTMSRASGEVTRRRASPRSRSA